MLEAANARPRFTISLKRSTQNLPLSTSSLADYPIYATKSDDRLSNCDPSLRAGQEQTPVVHKISRSQFIITHRKIGRIWPFDEQWPLVDRNCNAQECCGNRSGVLAWAFVLAAEQSFQFLLEITASAVLLCGFESVHGRPVEFSKCIN